MPKNELGNYIRERRQDLHLTQEELAERIGGSASQAEISRLERGTIAFPRRTRLEALAAALEVTLGMLLLQSGWMTSEEQVEVDWLLEGQVPPEPSLGAAMLAEVTDLHTTLLGVIARVVALEATIQQFGGSAPRPEVNVPVGVFDEWESLTVFRT